MARRIGIYYIRNKVNGKRYFGQTIQGLVTRRYGHVYLLRKNQHFNDYLQAAWNKYGEDSFEFLWYVDVRQEDLNIVEDEFIKIGEYNIATSATNQTVSDYTRQKLSIASSGENNAFYGKTHSEEVKQKISKVHKGKKLSKEHRKQISDRSKGKLKAGAKGYDFVKNRNTWRVRVVFGDKTIGGGFFRTEEEAIVRAQEVRHCVENNLPIPPVKHGKSHWNKIRKGKGYIKRNNRYIVHFMNRHIDDLIVSTEQEAIAEVERRKLLWQEQTKAKYNNEPDISQGQP